MISTTFGDMARQQGLSKNLRLAKSDISHLKQELATGQVRDKARLVQGNMIRLASLDRMIADTDARLGALSVLTVRLDTQQVAMIAVQDQVQLVADLLLRPELFSTDDRLSPVAAQVGQAFGAVIGFLNTQAGGRSLFAGQTTDQPALSDPSRMLADLALLIPSGAQKHVIDQIVDDWFAPSGGFEASGYLGGASDTTAHDLGGGSVLRLNWSATDETFRKTLSGLAKGALMTRDHTDISAETRRSVLLSVGGTAQANGALIRLINEDIGTAQARIEQATTRQQAAQVSATLARTNLIGADPYETATKLQDTISRVDQMFALTARLSRLSLSAYL